MSCEDLEPFVTITRSYGKRYATRHRRNCGVAMRSISAPSAGGSTMNESEYKQRARTHWAECVNDCGDYPIPNDHACMRRWVEHGNEAARRTLHVMGEDDLAKLI